MAAMVRLPIAMGLFLTLCVASGCSFRVLPGQVGASSLDLSMPLPAGDLAMPPALSDLLSPSGLNPDLAISADLSSGAHITVTSTGSSGPVNLTALGTSDWVKWGYAQPTDVDRKADGNNQITALTVTGAGSALKWYQPFPTQYSWSDGTSENGGHVTATANAGGVYTNAGGLRISVPAGRASRKVTVWVSNINAQARMQMSLSDGSTGGHDDSANTSNDGMLHDIAYTVDYSAASDNQQLTITWSLAMANGGTPNAPPAVALSAAVLTPPTTTSP